MFRDLAQLAASNGQLEQAITAVHQALYCEPNPAVRGRLALLAEEYRQRSIGPTDLRTRALSLLATGDVSGATKMLHSARRTDPKPALDYQLLAHVHRQRGDELAALAAQLLAREYDAQTQHAGDAAAIARNRGLADFARHLSTEIKAASTSVQSIAPNAERATPPRE